VKYRLLALGFAVLAGFAGPAALAHATTLTPNTVLDENTAGDGQCSLREAVGATRSVGMPGDCGTASGSDTIMLGAATYTLTIGGAAENLNQTGDLDVGTGAPTSVAVSGAGPGATTIDAGGLGDRIFEFGGADSFALSGVTLTGGHPPTGVPFPNNNGGAIRATTSGTLAIVNCVITGNHAADGAAGTSPAGTGGPGGAGGGIYATTRLTVSDSVISANQSGDGGAGGAGADDERANGGNGGVGGDAGGGGGIYAPGGTTSLTITNTTISGNRAGSGGSGGNGGAGGTLGGLATGGTGGTGGFGGPGGGLFVGGETLAIANSTLSGNSAGAGGTGGRGGDGNTGGAGGPGQTGGYAGGIASLENQINLTNVTLAHNSAGIGGHGGNGGPGADTGGNGGDGGNGARGGHGGALLTANLAGSDSLVNGTLSGNAAGAAGPGGSGGKGGGGATGTNGPPGAGGDIFGGQPGVGSALNLANTIMVGGSVPACTGFITNGGHNVFADGCLGPPGPNPLLGPLQDNGGPTETMALQPGSPAIDLVPPLAAQCPATDQRGVSRPVGSACDAGSYEVAPPSATTGPAIGVDSSNATLTGTVRPNSGEAAVHFEYGTTTGYGSQTALQHLSGSSDQGVAAALTGLSPSTTYHFRVIATAADGTATGADGRFTTAPPSSTGTGGDGTTPPALAAATRLTLVPSRFRGASSGPAAKPARVSVGTAVSYRLNIGARVRFTVARLLPGRRARGGRCVKPTRQNRSARKCTRRVRVRGSFTRTGSAGPNRFRFMGRIGGRKLKPGDYRLLATPTANGVRGRATSARFHIVP
jgi:hypothetical protein